MGGSESGKTVALPVSARNPWPPLPPAGLKSAEEFARLPGARVLPGSGLAPGPAASLYAFTRTSVHRNLYRVPLF
jgi:hypothetical protein